MHRQLHIWYVIDAYSGPVAGTEKQLLLLIREMAARGHHVRLLVLRHTDYTRTCTDFPCTIDCLNVGSLASARSVGRLLALRHRVRREKPDVIHAYFNDAAIVIPLFAKLRGVRIFTSRRDMGFWHTPARLVLLRLANRLADGIVCNSQAVAKLTAEREGTPTAKLLVIYNGLPNEAPPHEWHGTPVADTQGPAVCLVANIRPIKRMEDLIQAARRVADKVPACRFLIAGKVLDPDYARGLHELVTALHLEQNVAFLGELKDPGSLMRKCSVGVLCSESEGLSNTILEYMTNGLPAVCSRVGGNPELVIDGETGLLHPCGDVDGMAAALLRLLTEPGTHAQMAAAALERAKVFNMAGCTDAHLMAYCGHERKLPHHA